MKTYDMIQTLLEIQQGMDSSLEWLREGMGERCGFMLLEQRRLAELITELQRDHDQYTARILKLDQKPEETE